MPWWLDVDMDWCFSRRCWWLRHGIPESASGLKPDSALVLPQ